MQAIMAPTRPRETAWVWLAKIVSGVLVFALLMIHLVVNHMVAPGGLLTYADVITYYRNPIVPLMESAFLLFVVPHALIGARGIVLDLDPRPGLVGVLDIALVTGGMAVIGYGLWLVQVIVARAAM